jgi:hypothetical protein
MAPAAAEWLPVEAVAESLGWSLRTTQRRVAEWSREGWVATKREATDSRKWRTLVERASLDAFLAGPAARLAA